MASPGMKVSPLPPVGTVPDTMVAQVIRQDRLGEPEAAFQAEEMPTPEPGRGEVLVGVMAAGINYNNVWAAKGVPIDVIADRQRAGEPHDFHIGGSDAAGVVYAVGPGVDDVAVGDEVIIHPGYWDPDDQWVAQGRDPMIAPSARIWGYNTNFGAFAQFAIAQGHQCLPKAPHLSWVEAAAPTLVGTTAYRMLFGWSGHELHERDVVLVWGGSGGVGSLAIQIAKAHKARPIAVVSTDDRGRYCQKLGAIGYVDRTNFDHWGIPPHWTDAEGQKAWLAGAKAFGKAIWEVVGERVQPRIVIEHPGEATIPTSIFVCEPGGMVVICAGTTGYSAMVDLRYHWTRQKRLQGSHGTNDHQARAFNDLIHSGAVDPCVGKVVSFDQIPDAHQAMADGEDLLGNVVALVGASSPEEGREV